MKCSPAFAAVACILVWTAAASAAPKGERPTQPEPANGESREMLPETQVVRVPVTTDPTVNFRIGFQVGSQDDPPGKEGLAALTAAMLTEASTRANSYERILDLLFPLAGQYTANVDVEQTVIVGRIYKDNLPQYYRLFTDAILAPAFKQEDLDRLKSQTLNYLENTLRYAGDEELGKAVLYNAIFAGTPYGHIPEGTIATVKSITLADVREFYSHNFVRSRVVVGVGGGFDQSLVDNLRRDLGRLPAGSPYSPPAIRPKPIDGFQVTIVEKDAAATAISMGYPIDVLRGHKDWCPLALANSWLGEHRNQSSHLYQVIRELRGLNYGDYSYIEHFARGGELQFPPQNVARRRQIFEIWIRPVPNNARVFALRAALREYQRMVEHGLTEREVGETQKFLGKYVLNYAPTTMDRLGYALDDRFYDIRGSHLDIFRQRIQTMTLGEVNAAIKKNLQYGRMHVVLITPDAEALKKALVASAPSPYVYPTPKPEAILEEDRQISTFPLKIRPEDIKIVPVGELFAK